MMKDKAPISEFNFGSTSEELTPFDVSTLMQEYADGRRKFNQIDLKSANLSHAHLPYIQLEESLLQKADLRHAILAGASLNHIDLSSANLLRINLIAADLIRAKLAGANLTGAFLSGANLSGANLRKSDLTDCTLAGANLSGVDFSGAILKNTNMAGATLRGANLSAADLSELDLTGVSLEGTILSAEQGGATWTALQPGTPDEESAGAPQPGSTQGIPVDAYPLDAFDSSYEELMQDLAETTEWESELASNLAHPEFSESVTDSDQPNPEAFSPQSPFDSLTAEPPTGETAFKPDNVDLGDDKYSFETLALVPIRRDQHSPFAPPPLTSESPQDSERVLISEAEQAPGNQQSASMDAGNQAATEVETTLLSKGRLTSANPHQDEVIKSIQSVLNRRTHYSLQRKLLEVYGKRCAITGCPIRPLLDTVLIDSSNNDFVDHPSNGLVLRTDIKILYTLCLIAVHPTHRTVMLAPSLRKSSYGHLEGQRIVLPKQTIYQPNPECLQAHLDHCKWVNYGTEPAVKEGQATIPRPYKSEDRLPAEEHNLITKFALVAGGLVAGSLLVSLLWFFFLPLVSPNGAVDPNDRDDPVEAQESAVPVVTIDPENQIRLQLGPVVYPLGGVIFDETAYLSVVPLRQAGLISEAVESTELIETNGRRFVQSSILKDSGVSVNWDAETRTVILDCCSNPEIEPIDIAVQGQAIAAEGLIVEGSSYVPVEALDELNTVQAQVPADNFIGVGQQFYVKSSGLDNIGFDVNWDADSRLLNIE